MSGELRKLVLHGNSGLSSWTIVYALVPELRELCEGRCGGFGLGNTPADPSDFHRCLLALNLIPRGRERLPDVAAMFPQWRSTVENWAKWEALFEEESKRHDGMAPRLFKAMWPVHVNFRGAP